MINGDYHVTARAIAHQAGLEVDEVLDDPQAHERCRPCGGGAACEHLRAHRVPAQKLRIVTAFKTRGAVVGMTGMG